jgi:hypothetical protein
MKSKLTNANTLEGSLIHFFESAQSHRFESFDEFAATVRTFEWDQFKLTNEGVVFHVTRELGLLLHRVVTLCLRRLGTRVHDKDVTNLLFEEAAVEKSGDHQKAVSSFFLHLKELGINEYRVIAPNELIFFRDDIREVRIGPVRARVSDDVVSEINPKDPTTPWRLVVSTMGAEITGPGVIPISDNCWDVRVAASQRRVTEEMCWLINIGLGLLRLSYPSPYNQPHFPDVGERKILPTSPQGDKGSAVIMINGWPHQQAGPPMKFYGIKKEVLEHHENIGFKERAEIIFNPPSKSIAERISQGLGWLSRGRQCSDEAERFLYFFTAIEALLSTEDKSSPVVQTIARHASTIMSELPVQRERIAAKLRQLYAVRSSLVHGGYRKVSFADAAQLQKIVENIYWIVMNKAKIKISSSTFHESVASASYGAPWQPPS